MTEQHRAYTALLERHHAMLWQLCWKRASSDHDRCQDLMQDVSIQLWENFGKLRPDATQWQERAWVRWQARSVFYQAGRRQTLHTVASGDEVLSNIACDDEARHRKELIDSLISTLNPDDQRMMRLYLDGYCGDEIGADMGLKRDAVYQRMHRAIRKMRSVAFILLALLLTSFVAIAVVPEWRQFFFGGEGGEVPPADTIPTQKEPVLQPAVQIDTAVTIEKNKPADTTAQQEPLEKMPMLGILHYTDTTHEPLKPPQTDDPIVSVDGSRLTITGVEGELVRVYDYSGNLVAAQKATVICTIDLFPSNATYHGLASAGNALSTYDCSDYTILIGNRTPLKISLR